MFVHRLRKLYFVLAAVFCIEAGRLFHLQILSVEKDYAGQAQSRLYRGENIEPLRGTVRDRSGAPLAIDSPRLDLMIDYSHLTQPEEWLAPAQRLTGVPRDELLNRAQEIINWVQRLRSHMPAKFKRVREETIAHAIVSNITLEAVAQIEAQPETYPGLSVRAEHVRFYPGGDLACHALGFLGTLEPNEAPPAPAPGAPQRTYMAGDMVGKAGVEREYDAFLQGTAGRNLYERSVLSGAEEQVAARAAVAGDTVWLSFDSRVQRTAQNALRGNIGGAVVMDVRTGAIIALASSPGYDLNRLRQELPQISQDKTNRAMLNRCIQDPVMLASVMKLADSVAALQEGAITESTRLRCAGTFKLGQQVVHCSEDYAHGLLSVREALAQSCNCVFCQIGLRTGAERIRVWGHALGLATLSGIDLPHEWPGLIPDSQWMQDHHGRPWYDGDTMSLSIGGGDLQVTPVQAAVMTAAIANGGKILRPHVMMKITDAQGQIVATGDQNNVVRTLNVSPDTLRIIREGMEMAVRVGTARNVPYLKALHAAAKTGTGRPRQEKVYMAWFVAFAPSENPQICVAVEVQKTSQSGAGVAAPIGAEILNSAFHPQENSAGTEGAAPQ